MNAYFPKLFAPGRIGVVNLRNRVIMSLYPTKYAVDGAVTPRLIEFFRARARGGAAMIVLDGFCLDYPRAYKGKVELRADTPEYVKGLRSLIEAVNNEGARAFTQLNYPADILVPPGTAGAKEKKGRWTVPLVRGAKTEDLSEIVGLFAAGALRAREIGYDGVELQAGWGATIAQFLSPLTNKRKDKYGGRLEDRGRFLLEIVKEIKKVAGTDYPLQIKFTADEMEAGGFSLSDAEIVARKLEQAGADSLLVTTGNKKTKRYAIPPHSLPAGVAVSYAGVLKSVVNIPVIAMGKIGSPELAERTLADGHADMIGMTRALITDPEWPNKAFRGETEDIRGCIYCLDDCADKGVEGLGRACVNNPFAGLESELKIERTNAPKHVWVVGAGPAGMQAALIAAERGHYVRLLEKTGHLGGQFRFASLTPHKAEVGEVLRWLEVQIEKRNIDFDFNCNVTAEMIVKAAPDVVILGTGSEPRIPLIPGVENHGVYSAKSFLETRAEPGPHVVVIGAGDLGCEMAEYAADRGSKVTVLEMTDDIMPRTKSLPRADLLRRLEEKGVSILTRTVPGSIKSRHITAMGPSGDKLLFPADTVIYAVGNVFSHLLLHALQGKVPEVYTVGDLEEPGNVGHALRSAARVALRI